jgi:folylpolyglutamate synthase/dihydropteroate synthase
MTRNRDVNAFLSFVEGGIKKLVCTNIRSEPSAYSGMDIQSLIKSKKLTNKCIIVESVEEGINAILREGAGSVGKRIIITGSIFLVSDFLLSNKN